VWHALQDEEELRLLNSGCYRARDCATGRYVDVEELLSDHMEIVIDSAKWPEYMEPVRIAVLDTDEYATKQVCDILNPFGYSSELWSPEQLKTYLATQDSGASVDILVLRFSDLLQFADEIKENGARRLRTVAVLTEIDQPQTQKDLHDIGVPLQLVNMPLTHEGHEAQFMRTVRQAAEAATPKDDVPMALPDTDAFLKTYRLLIEDVDDMTKSDRDAVENTAERFASFPEVSYGAFCAQRPRGLNSDTWNNHCWNRLWRAVRMSR